MRKWKRDLLRLRQKIKQERNRINMTSQTLREARKYEEASEKMIKQEERPDFHLSVRTGWMNDPNGFSYITDSTICFTSITRMRRAGTPCTGGMR